MRLFVAVWPTPSVVAALASLDRPELPGVRWTAREHWHVTLRFIGTVLDEAAGDVAAALAAVAQGPVDASLGPSVRLLGREVVCVPVHGLAPLADAVRTATGAFGAPPERRPFKGHVTLARLRGRVRVPSPPLGQPIDAHWPAGEIHLVESHLSSIGPRYETLSTHALEGA